jgi:hypothetical protein
VSERFAGQAELARHAERVAEHALGDSLREACRQTQLEPSTEGMAEQAHLVRFEIGERELQAVDRVFERPPLRQLQNRRDHDAGAVGEPTGHGHIDAGLHGVAVKEDDRRPMANRNRTQWASTLGSHSVETIDRSGGHQMAPDRKSGSGAPPHRRHELRMRRLRTRLP